MNPTQRNTWEKQRAAGRLAWTGRCVLLTVGWVALGGSLAVWILGGAWKIVLYVLSVSAAAALLGSLHRWNVRERAYRAEEAQEALHHLS